MEKVQETITSSGRMWKDEELPSTKRGVSRTNGLGNPPSVSAKPPSLETSPGHAASRGNAFVDSLRLRPCNSHDYCRCTMHFAEWTRGLDLLDGIRSADHFLTPPARIALRLLLARRLGFFRSGLWRCVSGASQVGAPLAHLKLSLWHGHERLQRKGARIGYKTSAMRRRHKV
jgi:hypothetical protein